MIDLKQNYEFNLKLNYLEISDLLVLFASLYDYWGSDLYTEKSVLKALNDVQKEIEFRICNCKKGD